MTQYLIDFKNDAQQIDIDTYLSANNCQILKIFSKLENTYHVETDLTLLMTDIIDSIIDDDAMSIQLLAEIPVVPLNVGSSITLSTAEEKDWWKIYSVASIDLSNSSTVTTPMHGVGTNVYVIDSGIEITHPEFVGKDISLVYSFMDNFNDTTGHGTALSSVIVGNTCSMTDASLKVVKIFDNNQSTKQSDILYAFDAILHDISTSVNKVSIVNMSWSIARNTYVEGKILNLVNAGVLVVCASGNSGIPIGDVTPAAMSKVMVVGSYSDTFMPSNFSNYTGSISTTPGVVNTGALDIWAPGEQIWAASLGGVYGFVGGTSISAAIYSASVAYNASQLITETNDILSTFRTSDGLIDVAALTSKDRSNILNLSDIKYASSINKICTYSVGWLIIPSSGHSANFINKVIVKPGQHRSTYFSNILFTSAYEILTPLPPFVTIEKTIIIAAPTEEPLSVSGVDVYDIQLRIIPNNSNEPYTVTIKVVVTGSAFDITSLPTNDPLIEITSLASVCSDFLPPNCHLHNALCTGACVTTGKVCSC